MVYRPLGIFHVHCGTFAVVLGGGATVSGDGHS